MNCRCPDRSGGYALRLVTSMLTRIKKIQYSVHVIVLQYASKDAEAGENLGKHALSVCSLNRLGCLPYN
jgi:hypothetical protein